VANSKGVVGARGSFAFCSLRGSEGRKKKWGVQEEMPSMSRTKEAEAQWQALNWWFE